MKTSRLLKAEIILLVCVAVLWAVDLKTACVPRATAGALRQVVKITPNSGRTFRFLGTMCYHSGQEEAGDKAFAQATIIELRDADPNDADALSDLGDAYFDIGRYEDAIEAYRKSIELDPNAYIDCYVSIFRLGDAYYQLGDLESAIQIYDENLQFCEEVLQSNEEVRSLDSEFRGGYERLAGFYWELDQPEKSIETWKRAISCDPEWNWPHEALAFAHRDLGRYEEAIAEWKRVIELEPDDADAHYWLGAAYFDQERYEDAVEAYRKSIELDPNDFMAHYNLGIALDWLDRYEEKIEAFKEAIRIDPQDADAHFNLGKAYLQMGNKDSASEEYEVLKGLDEELAQEFAEELHELIYERGN